MNKNDFKEVMHIVACSEECERYYEELNSIRKRRKNLKTGIVCTASIIAVITVAFTTILLSRSFKKEPDNRNSEKILISTSTTDPTSEQTEPSQMTTPAATVERSIIGEELIISPDSSKPTTGHQIGMKCWSFYEEKVITIDAYMCQGIPANDFLDDPDGYPVFSVYQELDDYFIKTIKINNNEKEYEKKFTIDDLGYLSVQSGSDVFDSGHKETVMLDLGQLDIGDCASVVFSYGFFYFTNNPYNQKEKDNSWAGMRRMLFFYCGENGISISSNSCEDAVDSYNKSMAAKELIEDGHLPSNDVCCKAKDIYLKSVSDNICQTRHGDFLVNKFAIIDSNENESFLIKISCGDEIKLIGESEYTTDSHLIEIRYLLTDCSPYGVISIEVSGAGKRSNNKCSTRIFCASSGCFDYSSANSVEDLRCCCPELDDYFKMIDKSGETGEIIHSVSRFPSITVNGYIRWEDNSNTQHPAKNVTVNIYNTQSTIDNGVLIGSAVTNSNGYYTVTVPCYDLQNNNIFIRVFSSGLNITIKNSGNVTYAYLSSVYHNVPMGDIVNISYTASNMTCLGKSLGVHQALELAQEYMYSLENEYMSNLTVSFPDNSGGTTRYESTNSTIYVLSADAFDWDVLEHEYGHFVADEFGILAAVGGNHYLDEVLAVTKGKPTGIQLAWNEGWATYFSINLQRKMNASLMGIPNVGDEYYTDTVDSTNNYSIEYVENLYLLGESGEIAVSAILYDITDPSNLSDNDEIYCDNSGIWNIVKNSECKTLSSFITAFYNSNFPLQVKLKLGKTLTHFRVSADLSDIIAGFDGSSPTFSWTKQGGSSSYTNNYFTLAFYNSSYSLICRISAGNVSSRTLNPIIWNTICNSGSTVYCCVEAYQTLEPQTGAYYSNVLTINFS